MVYNLPSCGILSSISNNMLEKNGENTNNGVNTSSGNLNSFRIEKSPEHHKEFKYS